jgi:hypothetical protein
VADTVAGYQYTIPATGAGSDQFIVGFAIYGGRWSYASPPNNPLEWQALDEQGNVLWRYDNTGNPGSFLQAEPVAYFPLKATKKISFIMKTSGGKWMWGGNYAYLQGVRLYTVPYTPMCGDATHPYPTGDLNHDCKVNFADFAEFAKNWLVCYSPKLSDCTGN